MAQSELPGYLIAGLKVGLEDCPCQVALSGELGGVDVNGDQRFGLVNRNITPTGQPDSPAIKFLDLFFQPVFGKERLFTAKLFDSVDKMGGEFAPQIARAVLIF